jgi:hypothetical protein
MDLCKGCRPHLLTSETGTKQTKAAHPTMSDFGGKADVDHASTPRQFLTLGV